MSVIPKIKQTIENLERIRRFVSQCLNIDLQKALAKAKADGVELKPAARKRLEIDWGTIPGVDKPFLMQPGAEKMMKWLQLRPKFVTRDVEHPAGHLEVVSHVVLFSLVTKEEVFEGPDASCTTMETNFRFVWAEANDPGKEEKERLKLLGMGRNREVTKWINRKPVDTWVWQVRIENPNIWNERNKVRQMAEKRGLVKCLRQMGAISEIFNADPSEWNLGEETDDELDMKEDFTEEGRRVLIDGRSPSGKYVSQEAEQEQAKKNQQAVLERKLKENARHGHEPGTAKAKQAEATLDRVEAEDARFAAAKNVTSSGQQEAQPETKKAAGGTTAEAGAKPPKPKIPPGSQIISGNFTRYISSKTPNKGTPVCDVKIGQTWYKCWRTTLFPHFATYGHSSGGFVCEAYIDKKHAIIGLIRIGPTKFEADGATPVIPFDPPKREPGQEG